MAYANYAPVTIDNTQVSGTANLTNFPVLVSGTFDGTGGEADIRTTGNGGNVQNTDATGGASGGLTVPADLAFYDDTSATTQYDHEIIDYNATTGVLKAWVRIPSVSYNSDTTFYMHYNDSSITNSQESIGGTWNTNYAGVWHLQESSGTRYDSSGNGNNLTDNNTVTSATGKIGTGADFEKSNSEYLSVADAAALQIESDHTFTIQMWIKMETDVSTGGDIRAYVSKGRNGTDGFTLNRQYASPTKIDMSKMGVAQQLVTWTPSTATWYHLCVIQGSSSVNYFINGSSIGTNSNATAYNSSTTRPLNFGAAQDSGGTYQWFYDGIIEEARLVNTDLSTDWCLTEYNNQNAPGTFLTVGTEVSVGGGASIPASRRMIVMS